MHLVSLLQFVIFRGSPHSFGAASKVFLSPDFVGQMHFCFLVPSRNSISIARIEIMNNMQLIIGVVKSFRAKDAIAIPVSIQMKYFIQV